MYVPFQSFGSSLLYLTQSTMGQKAHKFTDTNTALLSLLIGYILKQNFGEQKWCIKSSMISCTEGQGHFCVEKFTLQIGGEDSL